MSAPNVFDIAREAGVSKSTAARALSGHGAVSDFARAKVLAAADQLKYRANTGARSLRRGENRLLGVVLPASHSTGFLSHTINAQKLEGVARGAERLAYDLQIFIEDLTDRDALRRLATDRNVRGLLFFGPVAAPVLEHLNEYRIPWVGLNWRPRQVPAPQAAYVWTDFHHAGCTLAGHLFDAGCKRLLAFDWLSADYGPFDDGLTQAVFDRNLPYNTLTVRSGREWFQAAPVVAELTRAFAPAADPAGRPDGVVLGSADAAIAAYRFFHAAHPDLVIGRDLRLAVFDDLDKTAALDPALTALAQNMIAIGTAAIESLDAHLTAGPSPASAERKIPGELRIRASSQPPAGGAATP